MKAVMAFLWALSISYTASAGLAGVYKADVTQCTHMVYIPSVNQTTLPETTPWQEMLIFSNYPTGPSNPVALPIKFLVSKTNPKALALQADPGLGMETVNLNVVSGNPSAQQVVVAVTRTMANPYVPFLSNGNYQTYSRQVKWTLKQQPLTGDIQLMAYDSALHNSVQSCYLVNQHTPVQPLP
jgi:hypothetical protein